MSIFLLLIFIIAAILMMFEQNKVAGVIVILSILGCFGYRLLSGEEVRSVISDSFFVLALIPFGLYAAKHFAKIQD